MSAISGTCRQDSLPDLIKKTGPKSGGANGIAQNRRIRHLASTTPELLKVEDDQGQTPLFSVRTAAIADHLIRHNADPHHHDHAGKTPLSAAMGNASRIEHLTALLEAGVNFHETGTAATSLTDALTKAINLRPRTEGRIRTIEAIRQAAPHVYESVLAQLEKEEQDRAAAQASHPEEDGALGGGTPVNFELPTIGGVAVNLNPPPAGDLDALLAQAKTEQETFRAVWGLEDLRAPPLQLRPCPPPMIFDEDTQQWVHTAANAYSQEKEVLRLPRRRRKSTQLRTVVPLAPPQVGSDSKDEVVDSPQAAQATTHFQRNRVTYLVTGVALATLTFYALRAYDCATREEEAPVVVPVDDSFYGRYFASPTAPPTPAPTQSFGECFFGE